MSAALVAAAVIVTATLAWISLCLYRDLFTSEEF